MSHTGARLVGDCRGADWLCWRKEAAVQNQLSPLELFLAAFSVASASGLAAYLRSNLEFTLRKTISSMLNSGLLGLGIAFLWYTSFNNSNNAWVLLGICLMVGLGGLNLLEFILQAMKKGGLDIRVSTRQDDDD
jgi:hypothetical protein